MLNNIVALLGTGAAASTTSFESIATVSLSSQTVNIEFSSIPSTYKHLQVRCYLKDPGGYVNNYIRFNSDTGTNYSNHYLDGDGSSATSGAGANTSAMATPVLGNQWGCMIMDVLDYADTNKYKTIRVLGGVDNNGSGYAELGSGAWRNTNAVTTITLISRFSGWAQYSHAALYGIKGA